MLDPEVLQARIALRVAEPPHACRVDGCADEPGGEQRCGAGRCQSALGTQAHGHTAYDLRRMQRIGHRHYLTDKRGARGEYL